MLDLFLVQLESILGKDPDCKAKNFGKVRELLRDIDFSSEKNGVILLPEMFATGYLPKDCAPFAEDFSKRLSSAEKESPKKNETVEFLQQLADETRCTILGAGIHKVAEGFTNHSGIFTPEGRGQVAGYDKCHPFFPELSRKFIAGGSINLFKTCNWKIASVICYDLRFPELFRDAVKKGANLITVQAAWPLVRREHWETLLKARAIENQVYIAAVNGVSPSEADSSKKLAGTSMIIDPLGNIISAGDSNSEAVVRGSITLEPLQKYRQDFPVLQGIVDQQILADSMSSQDAT